MGYSRASYVEFVSDMKVATLIGCHERAFAAFGGMPRKVLYDNMKTVVIERDVYGEGQHRYHAGFLDFTKHSGFRIKLCQPYRAQTKGKVERFNGYLRRSFYVPLASRLGQSGLQLDVEPSSKYPREGAFISLRSHNLDGVWNVPRSSIFKTVYSGKWINMYAINRHRSGGSAIKSQGIPVH
ncbi:hypothetical protein JOD97_006449 [Duganella sp. 1411]|nr:hypothetical protein [Duganella sp. 1411]